MNTSVWEKFKEMKKQIDDMEEEKPLTVRK